MSEQKTTNQENTPPAFAHLHVHSEYSLVDGMTPIKKIVAKAKEFGHSHIALTDHSVMFGAVDFYLECKKQDIIPIIGCDVLHTGEEETKSFAQAIEDTSPNTEAYNLVLLARNSLGYKKLMRIVSSGFIDNLIDSVPIIPTKTLDDKKNHNDLVALSGCQRGEFAYLTRQIRRLTGSGEISFQIEDSNEPIDLARKALAKHVKAMITRYGEQNYYIELIDNNLKGQRELIKDLVQAAKYFKLPIVASSDAHYLTKEDRDTHALLVAIKNSLTKTDIRNRLKNINFHMSSNEEIRELFYDYPEAISNALLVAAKCSDVEIEMDKFYLPKFDMGTTETSDESLVRLSREGLQTRFETLDQVYGPEFDEKQKKIYRDRLEYELGVILQMGFPGYFLIVQDFINWAKEQDIPVGPGRGSGAGSLVAYALRITDLDPIPYNLIFERFLNPERVSMPDFDVDFCQWRRGEVIQYVTDKYGAENVAQIITFGKLMAKGAFKSVARALGIGYFKVDQFTKLFPDVINITLQEVLEQEPKVNAALANDDVLKESMDYAFKIEGLASNTSVHAAGVVISDGPMTDFVPVYSPDGKSFVTQYEMKKAEKVGLVKFDFLGLKTLTVIKKTLDYLKEADVIDLNIETIPMDDKELFDFVSAGNTVGLFQLESSGMTALVKKLKPSCFEDIIALVALFRPGPLGSGMVDDFVERKHGRQEITYLHPLLEPILSDTYGMILYQEQVQKIAAVMANYSLGEADLLRRAMGKKIPEEMEKQKGRFLSGAAENNIDKEIAETTFDLMAEFANYGFNKSHSAAYGLVSYQTAYLKTHYPEYFMAAIMTCDLDNTSKIVRYIEDCRAMGYTINPPNINKSILEFHVRGPKEIDFGLAAIKGMGEAVLTPILEERDEAGPYKSLLDLARRVNLAKVGKKTLELLTQTGAFDQFGYTRKQLLSFIKEIVEFSTKHFEAKNQGQRSLFDLGGEEEETEDNSGASWEEVPKAPYINGQPFENDDLFTEKKLLGVFLTGHPLDLFQQDMAFLHSQRISDFEKLSANKTQAAVVALLSNKNERRTQKGSLMASFKLEQQDKSFEAVMFEKNLEKNTIPSLDTPVVAYGTLGRSFDQETVRFTLERIVPLEEIRQERIKKLAINLDMTTQNSLPSKKLIKEIDSLMKDHTGNTPVSFILSFDQSKISIRTQKCHVEASNSFIENLYRVPCKNISYIMQAETSYPEGLN